MSKDFEELCGYMGVDPYSPDAIDDILDSMEENGYWDEDDDDEI